MIVGWSVPSVIKNETSMTSDREFNDDDVITLDLGQARRNFGCDEALLREIATVFIEDVPMIIADLETAYARNDVSAVCRLAHSLKGLCATFGAEPARSHAQAIEHDAASNGRTAITQQRIRTLVHSLHQTIDTLRSELRFSA